MHKKLIAAAVSGLLAAPVVAQAQSTVQIYGVAEWGYGVLEQGNGRPRVDYNEVTGSYLGFRGTESLGGGLSAWFQCETTMDIRAFDQTGLCSRNTELSAKPGAASRACSAIRSSAGSGTSKDVLMTSIAIIEVPKKLSGLSALCVPWRTMCRSRM